MCKRITKHPLILPFQKKMPVLKDGIRTKKLDLERTGRGIKRIVFI